MAGAKPLVSRAFNCDPLSCLETLGAGQVIFEAKRIAIVGGGPAGLRAAEVCAAAGMKVVLFDAKRSVGRKFLVAGKGGLNLTNAEPEEIFANRYSEKNSDFWRGVLEVFDSGDLREWALGLGFETFATKSGRVYLKDLKAAGLLRRWVARLREMGVIFQTNHRLVDLKGGRPFQLVFENGTCAEADAVILGLGGGSWPETGSDGEWTSLFEKLGLATRPLAPANCGWEHDWPREVLQAAEGKPLFLWAGSGGAPAATLLDRDSFLGRILTGRIESGTLEVGMPVKALDVHGKLVEAGRATKVFAYEGLDRVPCEAWHPLEDHAAHARRQRRRRRQ